MNEFEQGRHASCRRRCVACSVSYIGIQCPVCCRVGQPLDVDAILAEDRRAAGDWRWSYTYAEKPE